MTGFSRWLRTLNLIPVILVVQNFRKEELSSWARGALEELSGWSLFDDHPRVHEHNAVCHSSREAHLMSNYDHEPGERRSSEALAEIASGASRDPNPRDFAIEVRDELGQPILKAQISFAVQTVPA